MDEDEAVTANYRGKTYYFCGDDCKEEFLETPEEFIEAASEMPSEDT